MRVKNPQTTYVNTQGAGPGEAQEPSAAIQAQLTDAEQRARLDGMLENLNLQQQSEAYSLPQLLGDPQAYAPIPGLFFKRPKLGHKMDLVRRFQAIQERQSRVGNGEIDNVDSIGMILPYAYLQADDGTFRRPSAQELLYEIFEDIGEIGEFCMALLTSSRRAAKEGEDASPNE